MRRWQNKTIRKKKRMAVRNGRGERVLALIHQPSNKVQGEVRRANQEFRADGTKKESDKTVKCGNTTAKMADEGRDRPKNSECDRTSLTPAFSTSPSSSGGWHNKRGRIWTRTFKYVTTSPSTARYFFLGPVAKEQHKRPKKTPPDDILNESTNEKKEATAATIGRIDVDRIGGIRQLWRNRRKSDAAAVSGTDNSRRNSILKSHLICQPCAVRQSVLDISAEL
jgi:hypothetical protein